MTSLSSKGRRGTRLGCAFIPAALLALTGTVVAQAGSPAADDDEGEADASSPQPKPRGKATQLGLSPQLTTVGGASAGPPAMPEALTLAWGFRFHGFFRAPMRLSMDSEPGRGLQFHAPPVTPDSNYTTWSFTNNNPGPWGEMIFQYGNSRATATMAIASYNITAGNWRELQDQFGIDRAFLTLTFPDAFGDAGMMVWNVGVFGDRYGAMGKYDGGVYDTYMIGRSRIAGATGIFDFDFGDSFRLIAEGGGGAKMDVQQWSKGSDCITTPANSASSTNSTTSCTYPSWQPYPGYAQMGNTMLAHAHLGGVIANKWTITLHGMYAWTKDAMRTDMNLKGPDIPTAARDGSMTILGADLRLDGGWMGDGYLGYSHIRAINVGVLADTVEVLHSEGGWQYAANYTGKTVADGTLDSLGFQYTFSLAAFLTRPQLWWGEGADFTIQIFGMLNMISGLNALDEAAMKDQGKRKLKWGTQWLYSPLPFLSGGLRFDLVQPNLDDRTHSFWVLSPRLVFRTEFVTREQITVQYQYYSYGSWYTNTPVASLPNPYGQGGNLWTPLKPDKHTFTIAASVLW